MWVSTVQPRARLSFTRLFGYPVKVLVCQVPIWYIHASVRWQDQSLAWMPEAEIPGAGACASAPPLSHSLLWKEGQSSCQSWSGATLLPGEGWRRGEFPHPALPHNSPSGGDQKHVYPCTALSRTCSSSPKCGRPKIGILFLFSILIAFRSQCSRLTSNYARTFFCVG